MNRALDGLLLASLTFGLFGVGAGAAPEAPGPTGVSVVIRQAHVLEEERTGVSSPVGMAFASASRAFYVVGAPPGHGSPPAVTDVVKLVPFELRPDSDSAGSARIAAALEDPVNMTYDARRGRLLLLGHARELLAVQVAADGTLAPGSLARRDAARLGLREPRGLALDPASGTLFVLDAAGPRLVRAEPASGGSFTESEPTSIDLAATGLADPRGLAFDPGSGHLYVRGGQTLYELSQTGELLSTRDLSSTDLVSPQGMVFAPSADQTDDPAQLSLYVADSGGGPSQSSGQIVELSLTPLVEAAAASFSASLVNTVDMALWDPPSPDPSGLAYLAASNSLIMCDGEVEETVNGITHFEGANVWEFALAGDVTRTANISKVAPTVVPMTNEPTGVAFNPGNGHYYFTDDNAKDVFDLNPGGDGLIGTSDDSWTSFDTNVHGNGDPEGIAFNSATGTLFVADGVNKEVYQYTTAGALVGQFDVGVYGIDDPETVEFNAQNETLLVLSNRSSGPKVVEVTSGGALVQTIDLSTAYPPRAEGGRKPAGMTLAPPSTGSSGIHIYIVDRGVDNNADPNAVDGHMFEFTSPFGSSGDQPPTVSITSPSDGAIVSGTIPVIADANDDFGVTQVEFFVGASSIGTDTNGGDGWSVSWNTTTVADGSHSLTARATDTTGQTTTSAPVNVTVDNGVPRPLYFSLRAGATVGGVAAANEDILFFDGTSFSLAFDGSDVGLGALRLDGHAWLGASTLLLSFDASGSVPGIAETVTAHDIVRFDATSLGENTAGSFSMHFDGSDVGLTTNANRLDAFELLSDGQILVSTRGTTTVSGVTGRDEDLLAFTATSLGETTAGSFALYFDGSDVGLGDSGEDVDAVAVDASERIYLSAENNFVVSGVSGGDEDVFVFTPSSLGPTTAGTYDSALYLDGSVFGLGANDVMSIDLP